MESNGVPRLIGIDPASLDRDQLIELVRELQLALRNTASSATAAARRSPAAVEGAEFNLVFDGGSLGTPGLGYGSYEIVTPAGSVAARQIEFGDNMTNNQAEFHALIAGLEDLIGQLGLEAASRSLAVRGDSQLVIRGLSGEWRVKHPGLRPLLDQASQLLKHFGNVDLSWHPRRESVKAFGH
jgi:ribonuclease HI